MNSRTVKIVVYCGSVLGAREEYKAAAFALGKVFAAHKITMIYGGGSNGLMGVLANSALSGGGKVIGIIPEEQIGIEIRSLGSAETIVVQTVTERKATMRAMADAFIAMPGGLGTLDEIAEAIAAARMGLHQKPIGLLNTQQFFQYFLKHFDHMIAEGFVKSKHKESIVITDDPETLIQSLLAKLG